MQKLSGAGFALYYQDITVADEVSYISEMYAQCFSSFKTALGYKFLAG